MANAAGQAFEKPNVRTGTREVDVPKSFAANFCLRYFNSTLIAYDTAVLHTFVFAAETFPISNRTKDAGAEKAVPFWFECAIVDGFGFGHLTMRPLPDLLR